MRTKTRFRGIQKRKTINNVNEKKDFINALDHDSLAEIFMLLSIPERLDVQKVCSKWQDVCHLAWHDIKKFRCSKSIGRAYDNRLMTQSYVEKVLLNCGIYLKELSLSRICNSSIMPIVSVNCKNLTKLEIEVNESLLVSNINNFNQAFTQLNKLLIIKLKIINDLYCDDIINLSEIINSLSEKINELHLLFKSQKQYKKTIEMTLRKFNNLESITLDGCYMDNNIIDEISRKITLVYFDFKSCIEGDNFFSFKLLVNLEKINITNANLDIKRKLTTDVLESVLLTCKKLKHFQVPYGSYDVSEIPLKSWRNCKNLEHLEISCNITDELGAIIERYCQNLKSIDIYTTDHVLSEFAMDKLTKLQNLEDLSITGRVILSSKSILAILNNCKRLKRLSIPKWTKISIDINSLLHESVLDGLSGLQYLEYLSLPCLVDLDDSVIIAISNICECLKYLDINNCGNITEAGLHCLTLLKKLENLDLSCNKNVTDHIISKLKRLKSFKCSECKKITDNGMIEFIKNCPDVEYINISYIDNITIYTILAAERATKNRINNKVLYICTENKALKRSSQRILRSQWLAFDDWDDY